PHERLPANTDLTDAASHVEPRLLEPLDAQLLVLAAEDTVDTLDEERVEELLAGTLCGVQAIADHVPLRPLSHFVARRLSGVVARVPDGARRRGYYRTGLALASCEHLAERIAAGLAADPDLIGPERFNDLRQFLFNLAAEVREV
ncbi:MAG: hypothetical protein ACRDJF_07120, partial [Actinomycetota bacterium]